MSRISYIRPTLPSETTDPRLKLFDILKESGAIKPDTQITIRIIDRAKPNIEPYVETLYFDFLHTQDIIEAAIQSEREGYDAVVIACCFDPGVDQAREALKIPVVAPIEASFSFAHMLARKKESVAIITIGEKAVLKITDLIDKYGFGPHVIPSKPVRQIPLATHTQGVATCGGNDVRALKDQFAEVARGCIRDGAEIIIPGCAGTAPLLQVEGVLDIDGVPILNPVVCAIKMAENLMDFQKVGTSVSRKLMYRSAREEWWDDEREPFGFASKLAYQRR